MNRQTKETVRAIRDYALDNDEDLYIVSGEGEQGEVELYTDRCTVTAIYKRLSEEIGSGDRWARVQTESGYKAD